MSVAVHTYSVRLVVPTLQPRVYICITKFVPATNVEGSFCQSARTSDGATTGAGSRIAMKNCALQGSSGEQREGRASTRLNREDAMTEEKWRKQFDEMIAEHRELNKLIPLDKPKT